MALFFFISLSPSLSPELCIPISLSLSLQSLSSALAHIPPFNLSTIQLKFDIEGKGNNEHKQCIDKQTGVERQQ